MKLKSDEPLLLKIYFNNSLLSLSSIPSEALPFLIDFISELPRNPSGKILKKELRAPYWAGRDRQIN